MTNEERQLWAASKYKKTGKLAPDGKTLVFKGDVWLRAIASITDSGELIFDLEIPDRFVRESDFPGKKYERHPDYSDVWYENVT